MSSMKIKSVYDPSTDKYYSSQGLLMEHELLGRFKDYLNFTFANNFIGTKSLDQIADTVENSAPAKVLIELYPVMGKTLIRILLSQKIRDYIDAAEYRRTT